MSSIALRLLFRKGGTASSILMIALLVSVLSSTQSIINYVNLQSETLGKLVHTGGTYLILSRNSTSTVDSRVEGGLTAKLGNLGYVKRVVPQKILMATIITNASSHTVRVRYVHDVLEFLEGLGAYLNGTVPKSQTEGCMGELLARMIHTDVGGEVLLDIDGKQLKVRVVGVFRSQTQSDVELLTSMETAEIFQGGSDAVSLIEFSLREGVDSREALNQIALLLPGDVKVVQVQRLREFVQQTNTQTLVFLRAWSLAVYAAIATASYMIAIKLVTESSYELAMLRALGIKRRLVFALVLAYTTTAAFLGSILGVAIGTVGAQMASTALRWLLPNVDLAPFIEADQAVEAVSLTLVSSILGCVYPALRLSRIRYMEQPL